MINLKIPLKKHCLMAALFAMLSFPSLFSQVTVQIKNKSIKEALKEIESKSDYKFFYNNDLENLSKHKSLEAKNQTIAEVMNHLLSDTNIGWKQQSENVILLVQNTLDSKMSSITKEVEIKGVVEDALTGDPLIGVSVMQDGTSKGVITNIDGEFKINVPEGANLTFSYVGYLSKTIKASQEYMRVSLSESSELLDEVVVVGYGVMKKSVLTTAISSVKANEMEKVTPSRVDNVIRGMVSGVDITAASGQPGDGSRVRVRGVGTINDSNPLYIVDGMPVGGGIDYLNPTDIESVEVLKDAASAAIYGARAANGVILITTKKGTAGKSTIHYNFQHGYQNPWKKRSVLNATEYATLINEMMLNDNKNPIYADPKLYGKGTDWQKELFNKNAPVTQHQLSVSGGNESLSYFVSFGYFNQEGIIGGNYNRSNYDRYSIRANNNYRVFDDSKNRKFFNRLMLGHNLSYSRVKSTGISTNSEWGSPLGSAITLSPILTVYAKDPEQTLKEHPTAVRDKNGNVYTIPGADFNEITNPLAALNLPGDKGNSDKFVGNFFAELNIIPGLQARTSYGFDLAFWGNDGYRYPYYLGPTNLADMSAVWSSMNRGYTWLTENTLTYSNTIGLSNFTFLLGQSAQSYRQRGLSGTGFDLSDINRPYIDATQRPNGQREASGFLTPYSRLASYFGRLSYNYAETYLAEITLRRDGSSNFGPNHKWAMFPSVSFGWNITNEKFMENKIEQLSSLKLRASWGKNGNQSIEAFRYLSIMQGGNNYNFGQGEYSNVAPGFKPNGYPNRDIKWEESIQTDIGFDSYWLNGSLNLNFDYYVKTTNGMLMTIPLPEYLGDTRPIGNVGKMKNSGIEFDFSYKFNINEIEFSIGGNASYVKNKLIELGNDTGWQNFDSFHGIGTISRGQNGRPFPFFYGFKTDGIFQNWDEVNSYVDASGNLLQPNAQPGDVRFVKMTGDGPINDEDRVYIGKGMPNWTSGISLSAAYKDIDFSAMFYGTFGNKIFDASRRIDLPYLNLPDYMLDRWVGPNTSNRIPRLSMENANDNWRSSDLYIKDGSFVRLRSLQIGYTLPKNIANKILFNNLRVYMNAENLLTFTKYEGFDPEISSGGTSLGIDKGVYPQPRIISFGFNLIF